MSQGLLELAPELLLLSVEAYLHVRNQHWVLDAILLLILQTVSRANLHQGDAVREALFVGMSVLCDSVYTGSTHTHTIRKTTALETEELEDTWCKLLA